MTEQTEYEGHQNQRHTITPLPGDTQGPSIAVTIIVTILSIVP